MFYGFQEHEVVRFTRRDHLTLGPRLFIYQPRKATDQLHVLHDSDFLEGSESDIILFSKYQPYKAVSPRASCDLFLTSVCLFEHEPGVVTSFKAVILQKWQSLSGADEMESIMPLFYRAATIDRSYRKRLHAEIAQIDLNTSADASRTKAFSEGVGGRPPSTPTAIHRSGYSCIQQASAHLKGGHT